MCSISALYTHTTHQILNEVPLIRTVWFRIAFSFAEEAVKNRELSHQKLQPRVLGEKCEAGVPWYGVRGPGMWKTRGVENTGFGGKQKYKFSLLK